MTESIVNEQRVPLDYVLNNDDRIIINSNLDSSGPTEEWLGKVVTAKAKRRIEES